MFQILRQQKQLCFAPPQGYAPLGSARASCSSGVWSVDLENVSCAEGVALVTGGWNQIPTNSSMEVYGPGGMRIMLGLLPFYIHHHRSLYTGTSLVMCGKVHINVEAIPQCFRLMFKLDGKRSGELFFHKYFAVKTDVLLDKNKKT